MQPTRVVVADDNANIRKSIRTILDKDPGIDVVGEASNGVEALQNISLHSPDVLLLDMEMPVMDGLGVVRQLSASEAPVKILVLSAYDDEHYVNGVLAHGVAGYLTKDEAPYRIAEAIRRVADGENGFFSKRVETKLSAPPGMDEV